jgi:hypothetical protein
VREEKEKAALRGRLNPCEAVKVPYFFAFFAFFTAFFSLVVFAGFFFASFLVSAALAMCVSL